jgi:hypothetical protein
MNNTPWIPYTPDSLPKKEGYYLTCRGFSDDPDLFAFDVLYFGQGSFFFSGVVAYMEIPPVPQEFETYAN